MYAYVCIYICIYICIHKCVCVYIYIYIYIYIYTHTVQSLYKKWSEKKRRGHVSRISPKAENKNICLLAKNEGYPTFWVISYLAE